MSDFNENDHPRTPAGSPNAGQFAGKFGGAEGTSVLAPPAGSMSSSETSALVYVVIERQHSADLAIAYPSQSVADHALDHSPLIDAFCEEDALDCYVSGAIPDGAEVIIADADDIATMLGETRARDQAELLRARHAVEALTSQIQATDMHERRAIASYGNDDDPRVNQKRALDRANAKRALRRAAIDSGWALADLDVLIVSVQQQKLEEAGFRHRGIRLPAGVVPDAFLEAAGNALVATEGFELVGCGDYTQADHDALMSPWTMGGTRTSAGPL